LWNLSHPLAGRQPATAGDAEEGGVEGEGGGAIGVELQVFPLFLAINYKWDLFVAIDYK
jgi:hypothetical protein